MPHIFTKQSIPLFFAEAIVRMSIVRYLCKQLPIISSSRVERYIIVPNSQLGDDAKIVARMLNEISFAIFDNDEYVFSRAINLIYQELSMRIGLPTLPHEIHEIGIDDLISDVHFSHFDVVIGIPQQRPLSTIRKESIDAYNRLSSNFYTAKAFSNLAACCVEYATKILKPYDNGTAYLLMQELWMQKLSYSLLRRYLTRETIASKIYDFDGYPIDEFTPQLNLSIFERGEEREFINLVCSLTSDYSLMSFLLHPHEDDIIRIPIEELDSEVWKPINAKALNILNYLKQYPSLGQVIDLSSEPERAMMALRMLVGRFFVTLNRELFLDFADDKASVFIRRCDEELGWEGLYALLSSSLFSWYYHTTTSETRSRYLDVQPILQFPLPDRMLYQHYRYVLHLLAQVYSHYTQLITRRSLQDWHSRTIQRHVYAIIDYLIYELYFQSHMKQNNLCVFDEVQSVIYNIEHLSIEEVGALLSNWYLSVDCPVREKMQLIETRSRDIIYYIRTQA